MNPSKVVGILGGGQLGRMLIEPANRLNVRVVVLDAPDTPAKQVQSGQHVDGDFKDSDKVALLASQVDVVTVEIEHINVDALEVASRAGKAVQPSPQTLRIIQDKFAQKLHLIGHKLAVAESHEVANRSALLELIEGAPALGYPVMLKAKRLAYDGKGNAVVRSAADIDAALASLGHAELAVGAAAAPASLYVEKWAPFVKELAVMVVRALDGTVQSFPVVETIHKNSICHVVYAPAQVDGVVAEAARQLAEQAIRTFDGAGVFGVEMFLLPAGKLLINEIAPRPHNSGHYTIEACHTSQYEQHLRAILGLPLGSCELKVPASVMVNIVGDVGGMTRVHAGCAAALGVAGASVHLYGKKECRVGRKMGHITVVANSMVEAIQRLRPILDALVPEDAPLAVTPSPVVSIIMGSDSDLPTMKPAAQMLRDFDVPFELTIVSAHRTPERMMEFAKSAHLRGIKVIIAAAGGAAHLPGMVAAVTPLPVIGVPVALRVLDGQDSLYSIVQMPRGVPVATVAINNSTNAALLAVRILGAHDAAYLHKMSDYQRRQEAEVLAKVDVLAEVGWEKYTVAH